MTAPPTPTAIPATLDRFVIRGLYGHRDLDVKIAQNTLVIVGENGSGKTTFLRILVYFLSGSWRQLLQYKFTSVHASISKREYSVTRAEIEASFPGRTDPIAARRASYMRHAISEADLLSLTRREFEALYERERETSGGASIAEIERARRESEKLGRRMAEVRDAIGAQVLYLPTYRRIERELTSILPELEELRRTRHGREETPGPTLELVEFGMGDVERSLSRALVDMKDSAREGLNRLTLRYLGDVVRGTYNTIDIVASREISPDSVQAVLDRIGETVLSVEEKAHVRDVILAGRSAKQLDDHEKIIHHYFSKLREFQEALESRERNIAAFANLCNKYIVDKRFVYDSAKFSFEIHGPQGGDDRIRLADLSSGEKQIVSLFSHLYLSGEGVSRRSGEGVPAPRKFLVIIDEPELSLSVPWQREFLQDIRRGDFCAGIVAATHSPFIYENELKPFTHSLGEFGRL